MWINEMYDKNACMLGGMWKWLETWSWQDYKDNKIKLWEKLVLIDMIGQPVMDAIPANDDILSWKYPEWTIFALYCHSGWSSSYMQMQLQPNFPQYKFINIAWWIMSYNLNFND